jgi:endonuclease/exonuclease/phosphatase family metal-dependent hydrolase
MLQKILTDHILVGDLNMEAEECRDRLGDSFCTSLDHCAYISHIPTSKTLDYVCAPDRMSIGSVQTVESELSDHRGLVVGVQ